MIKKHILLFISILLFIVKIPIINIVNFLAFNVFKNSFIFPIFIFVTIFIYIIYESIKERMITLMEKKIITASTSIILPVKRKVRRAKKVKIAAEPSIPGSAETSITR